MVVVVGDMCLLKIIGYKNLIVKRFVELSLEMISQLRASAFGRNLDRFYKIMLISYYFVSTS